MGDLKKPLGTGSPCMDYTFRDTLPIKIGKFLDQMIILKKNWACELLSLYNKFKQKKKKKKTE